MPIFSDDDSFDESDRNSAEILKPRKSKSFSYKALFNSNDDDSDYEEPQHDSDNDPDFKYNDNESISDGSSVNDDHVYSDDNFSMFSSNTDIQKTLDMLDYLPGDIFNLSRNDNLVSDDKSVTKHISKRKISKECLNIYGKAQSNLWDKNYDVAMQHCYEIIKEYPSFNGSYETLSTIYEAKGDFKKSNQLKFNSAMCNPMDINSWIQCIENTKATEGVDRAIMIAKLAVSRTLSSKLRDVLVRLLEEGGYEKSAMAKKLVNMQSSPVATTKLEIEKEVEELFYLSEKFESLNDACRSCECLEIMNKKYPDYLSDDKLKALLKMLIKLKRFTKVLAVTNNIDGVKVNLYDLNESSDLIQIESNVMEEDRRDIVYAILMAILHSKMESVVRHRSFTTFLRQLDSCHHYFLGILGKLFNFEFYDMVIDNSRFFLNYSDEKLMLLKLIGKSQEKLNQSDDALSTYDYIIREINGKDPSIWELKANLLYNLKREQDAINVLAESQKFVHDHVEEHMFGKLIRKPKPTKESAQLLYKLCQLLDKEHRIEEYVKVAWKYIFIDSYEYFKVNKIKLFCEDMDFAKTNFFEITNSLWIKYGENSNGFRLSHAKLPYETEAWTTISRLLDIMIASTDHNMVYIEILSQWGLFLQRYLNWNHSKRERLSSIYISAAFMNRIKDQGLRGQCSSHMILSELRTWKSKYGETVQYWNMVSLYCHLAGSCNNRYVLRSIAQTKNSYLPEIINAGYVVSNNTKLSLAVNGKVHFQHPENAQVCLHLAITFLNAAISRTCQDPYKTSLLAINFMSKYRERRGDCQETWYNLGRFYHRISYYQYAMACYEKCLVTPPIGSTDKEREITDLTMDAAYNLVLIYKERNNRPMCAFLTQKYLTI